MQKIDGEKKQIKFTSEQLRRLEKVQERHNITQAEAVRKLLDTGLDVYEEFSYIGLPQMSEMVKRLKQQIRTMKQPRLV